MFSTFGGGRLNSDGDRRARLYGGGILRFLTQQQQQRQAISQRPRLAAV